MVFSGFVLSSLPVQIPLQTARPRFLLNLLFDVTNYLSSPNDKQHLEPPSPSYCWVMYASINFRAGEALFSVLPTKFRGRIYPDSFILLWYNTTTKVACKRKHLIWF